MENLTKNLDELNEWKIKIDDLNLKRQNMSQTIINYHFYVTTIFVLPMMIMILVSIYLTGATLLYVFRYLDHTIIPLHEVFIIYIITLLVVKTFNWSNELIALYKADQ